MLKLRRDEAPLSGEEFSQFSDLINEVLGARTMPAYRRWLQSTLQHFIPHDVFIVAWGDFNLGVVHFEVVSQTKSQEAFDDAESVKQMMSGLYSRWTSQDHRYFCINVGPEGFQLVGINGPLTELMATMKSALVHGVVDSRGGRDYIYAFFSQYPKRRGNEAHAIKVLMPYIDNAFRQLPVPAVKPPDAAASPHAATELALADAESSALDEAEIAVMRLVVEGKTNEEIGAATDVSLFTVKNMMQRIFKKLDVFNRSQAIVNFKNTYGATSAQNK
jgi:transcriptional regulator EpsA